MLNADVVCTQSLFIVSPVKKSDNLRLNGITSCSDSDSLLLRKSSPNIIVLV